jgi:glyoxylase-like metal-dependent hydrolase (beta-lactamase superfamily II)
VQFGDYRVEVIPTQSFGLDGGAMFGVVPRVLWSRVSPPDEQNRIRLNTNCLYIETSRERILVETGCGDKFTDKLRAIYNVARTPTLPEQLQSIAGVSPEQITIVVNTHLHFDHAGGNTRYDTAGKLVPTFPNARYFVSRGDYEHGENPTERDRASYFPENWRPLAETGQLELKEAGYEVAEGLTMETVTGHNRTMQCMRLDRDGQVLYNFADLVPTRHHIQPAWLMGYDLYPLETLENKKRLLPQAAREDWMCLFIHDPDQPLNRVVEEEGKLRASAYE